jgi:hypothetical protein
MLIVELGVLLAFKSTKVDLSESSVGEQWDAGVGQSTRQHDHLGRVPRASQVRRVHCLDGSGLGAT